MVFAQLLLPHRRILFCAPEKRDGFGRGKVDYVLVPAYESRS